MARRGRLCSNCAWQAYHNGNYFSHRMCECPKQIVTRIDPFKGKVRDFGGEPPRCENAYARHGCKWKEAGDEQR